ncbi:MAG: hypothetical protein ACI8PZ_002757 [Myxococcota bacterium]|jgi:hypothetical protein
MAAVREGLTSKAVTERAAAVRALGREGGLQDMDRLIDLALGDKSPSVRLYAAAAAVDVACRQRAELTPQSAAAVLERVKRVDPGDNPSLVMLYAAWPDRRSLDRLGRLLRDPRSEVRAAAAMAVRRAALSADAMRDPTLRDAVRAWIDSDRLPPDPVLELLRLVGEAGWTGMESAILKAASAGRPHGAVAEEVAQRLTARDDPADWEGLWVGSGVDALAPPGDAPSWRVVVAGTVHGPAGSEPLQAGAEATIGGRPARRIFTRRTGRDGDHAGIQVDGATLWRVEGKALVEAAQAHVALFTPAGAEALATLLPTDGVLARRVHAQVLLASGDGVGALLSLEGLASAKRAPIETFFHLGCARQHVGDTAGARTALEAFLDKAARRSPHRAEAQAILDALD